MMCLQHCIRELATLRDFNDARTPSLLTDQTLQPSTLTGGASAR